MREGHDGHRDLRRVRRAVGSRLAARPGQRRRSARHLGPGHAHPGARHRPAPEGIVRRRQHRARHDVDPRARSSTATGSPRSARATRRSTTCRPSSTPRSPRAEPALTGPDGLDRPHHDGPSRRGGPFGVPGVPALVALASDGDPRTRVSAGQAARQARRLPDEGRARRRRLRRQGAEPAQPGALVLAEAGARWRDPPHPERHRPRRRRRGDPDRLGLRGAAPRGEPHQALPAAVQRPAQGRQELPVHQGDAGRRLPAGRAHAQAGQRRQPLLRAVRLGTRAWTSR